MSNRSGKPGAVPATSLKAGQQFRYDTCDAVASTPVHMCSKPADAKGRVEIKPFCDGAMTSWLDKDTYVFPLPRSRST